MKYILFLSIICLSACNQTASELHDDYIRHDDYINKTMEFHKNANANVCFATLWLGRSYGMMASIPCTPEVEKQIQLSK